MIKFFLILLLALTGACRSNRPIEAAKNMVEPTKPTFNVASPVNWKLNLQNKYDYCEFRGGYVHQGFDINKPTTYCDMDKGEPVYSITDGKVEAVDEVRGGGVLVFSETPNGNRFIRYGHTQNILVKVGDTVKSGQRIASIGNVFGGNKICAHLHLDVRLPSHPHPKDITCSFGGSNSCVAFSEENVNAWYENPKVILSQINKDVSKFL